MTKPNNIDDDRFQPQEMKSEGGPLVAYHGNKPPAPDWFTKAIAVPATDHRVTVKGTEVAYRQWGDREKPGLLFCHGNGAHAQWWDWICPSFMEDYNVVALSLSGMGDSGWRDAYTIETYSEEQVAVAEDAGMFDNATKPVLIAHSFGALISLHTGSFHGEKFKGLVHIDSPVNPLEEPRRKFPRQPRPNKIYDTLEQALGRFRLAPPQPCDNHYIMDYIARTGLKQVSISEGAEKDGWTWKFDPGIWRPFETVKHPELMTRSLKCPIACIKAENTMVVDPERWAFLRGIVGPDAPMLIVKASHHHVMLDQPLALIEAFKDILSRWASSPLHPRSSSCDKRRSRWLQDDGL